MENNNSSLTTWTVVHFIEDDSVEAVPTNWIQKDLCYWPPWTRTKLTEAIKNNEPFNSCWPIHKIKQFRNATFDDYLSARIKSQRACLTSDLNSEGEGTKRRIVKNKIFDSSSSGSEGDDASNIPAPPKLSLKTKPAKSTDHIAQKQSPLREKNISSQLSSQLELSETTTRKHCCCKEVKKMLDELSSDLSKKMASLKASLYQVREDLNIIIDNNSVNNKWDSQPQENFLMKFKFPLEEHEKLLEVEHYLEDKNQLKQAIQQLSKLGGKDTYEFVKRCFVALISDKRSKEYTYDGTKVKLPFKTTMVCSLLIAAAECHNGADKKNTEISIRKWLRRSSERSAYKTRNMH